MSSDLGCSAGACGSSARSNDSADELARRMPNQATVDGYANPRRGWERLYVDHVLQADRGADLDFLVGSSGSEVSRESH